MGQELTDQEPMMPSKAPSQRGAQGRQLGPQPAKHEQKTGQFFPERYQHGGYELVEAMIDRYLLTIATKNPMTQLAERFFAKWWKEYFTGKRLNVFTVRALEEARQTVLATVVLETKEKGDTHQYMTPTGQPLHGLTAPCVEWCRA